MQPITTFPGSIPVTEVHNFSIHPFFKRLSDISDLLGELDSIKGNLTYPEAYVSVMLLGSMDRKFFKWVVNQLTIDKHWSENWIRTNKEEFEKALPYLDFNQKFALFCAGYRLARLTELKESDEATILNCRQAASVFKNYLINLINDNFAAFQNLDLSNLSIRTSEPMKFHQSLAFDQYLDTFKGEPSVPRELDDPFKIAAAASILTTGIAVGTYLYRSFKAELIPPPPPPPPPQTAFDDLTKYVNDPFELLKIIAISTVMGLAGIFFLRKQSLETQNLNKETSLILTVLEPIEEIIKNPEQFKALKDAPILQYSVQLKAFLVRLREELYPRGVGFEEAIDALEGIIQDISCTQTFAFNPKQYIEEERKKIEDHLSYKKIILRLIKTEKKLPEKFQFLTKRFPEAKGSLK